MKTHIDSTQFGSITVNGKKYHHDIYISLNGEVNKRKKKLSKEVYGTSHTLSLQEAEQLYESEARTIIIGAGQYGVLELSEEADKFFKKQSCEVLIDTTPKSIELWNNSSEKKCIGLFHTTC
jgi:hypothetical protein